MFTINSGKNVNSLPPIPSRYEVDSKFKSILDLSSKLEAQCNQAKTLKQLFSSALLTQRQRLCEEVKVIFRFAPIEYGRHCEEILWKRNYYDYVKFFKINRKQISLSELAIFRMHLTSGIGHYQSLFFSFYKTFNLTNLEDFLTYLPFKPNFIFKVSDIINQNGFKDARCNALKSVLEDQSTLDENNYIGDINDDDEGPSNELDFDYVQDEKFLPTLNYLAHRFCICLGDLTRYYVDFFPQENSKSAIESRFSHYYFNIASFYYKSASIIEPSLGMPFNQLGTLYSGSYLGLDSLYYYFRCLNSKKTFAGVEKNMQQTFDYARKMLSGINGNASRIAKPGLGSTGPTNQLVKEAVLRLINLLAEIFTTMKMYNDSRHRLSVAHLLNSSNEALLKVSMALIAGPSTASSRTSLNSLSTESIFQVVSIFAILIEQTKESLKKNSIAIKFEIAKSIKSGEVLTDNHQKGNFILFTTYRFLFQFMTLLIKQESGLLRKELSSMITYTSANNKSRGREGASFDFNIDRPKNGKAKLSKKTKPVLGTSFSSDFNDNCEDSVTLNQLKSTAVQTIVGLFDQSDNEDDDDGDDVMNCYQNEDDSDNESVSDLIDKLSFSDDENDLMDGSLIDQALVRNTVPRQAASSEKPTKRSASNVNSVNADSKTMDQVLNNIYTQSNTAVIKFFSDFLQSNSDFLQLLENLDILPNFFEAFYAYFNLVSEFDFKLVNNFRSYVSKCTLAKGGDDHKKIQLLLELKALIGKLSTIPVTEFKQRRPLSSEVDYLHITGELSDYFNKLFGLSADSAKNNHQINLQSRHSNEEHGFICTRSILVFGVKLTLLSLNSPSFQMSLQDYSDTSVHNLTEKKPVKFVFTLAHPKESLLSPFSPVSNSLPINNNSVPTTEPLINFNDASDKEVENVCSGGGAAHLSGKQKFEKKKPINVAGNSEYYKSVNEISKLPFVLIDPYIYLENLNFVRELVTQKKAFLIVPQLATDFLDNIKEINEKAREASIFFSDEFFRGSRLIHYMRNADRLELSQLQYAKYAWRRDSGRLENGDSKVQDLALFYELLEHCHYLLENKVLTGITGDNCANAIRITLVTNNIGKWPSAAPSIAKAYGVDIQTTQSFQEKYCAVRLNKPFKQQSKGKKPAKASMATSSSPMYFQPIQNARAEMFVSHPLT